MGFAQILMALVYCAGQKADVLLHFGGWGGAQNGVPKGFLYTIQTIHLVTSTLSLVCICLTSPALAGSAAMFSFSVSSR